ncbi:MAG: hypothetical protein ACYSUM_10455 [Planctomycetota bacterium]|jgi:hypothetical protein
MSERPRVKAAAPLAGASSDVDRLLAELLQATSGMGPSLPRAVEMLEKAMGFTQDPRERRLLIRVAVHDIFELAVRDAVAATREAKA